MEYTHNTQKTASRVAAVQKQSTDGRNRPMAQLRENHTGLPDHLKAGIENLSGYSMDDVKVHYHSTKPAGLQAHAYAQGSDIHLASGQERHLPHEAWHVVQQKQGRVRPTMQLKGKVNINDDAGLEKEADVMGMKALHTPGDGKEPASVKKTSDLFTVQRAVGFEYELDGSDIRPAYSKEQKKLFGKNIPPQPLAVLRKGLVIVDFETFDLSVDETPVGFDLEIRIKPVDHINRDSVNGLKATVYQILGILRILSGQDKPVSADYFGGNPHILISGDFSSGSLQATTGLSLTALHAFLSGQMGNVHERRQHQLIRHQGAVHPETEEQTVKAFYTRKYGEGSSALFQKAIEHTAIVFPRLPETSQQQVAAVVTSILTIPVTARAGDLPYAKSATTLLARSDYATIFNQLPASVLMNKTILKNLIMVTLNVYLATTEKPQVGFDSRVYPENSIRNSPGLSLTFGQWLEGILPSASTLSGTRKPVDHLSKDNYPRGQHPHDDFSQLESLGEYGERTDPGEQGKPLPIFEFRKYLKVPDHHLLTVIEGIWELVHMANKK